MMTNWTPEQQQRFTELRLLALDRALSTAEEEELRSLRADIAKVEEATLAPALQKLEQEQVRLQTILSELTQENEELMARSHRQRKEIRMRGLL